jgi:hypothetical protein
MGCVEREVGDCGNIIVCDSNIVREAGETLSVFPHLTGGSINTHVSPEDDIVYYAYVNSLGGGFIVTAKLSKLSSGECGLALREALVPLISTMLREDPRISFILMIIEEKMLR